MIQASLSYGLVAQFHPITADIRRAPFIHDTATLERFVLLAKEHKAIILYTLVLPDLCERLVKFAEEQSVVAIDLLGSLIRLRNQNKPQVEAGARS